MSNVARVLTKANPDLGPRIFGKNNAVSSFLDPGQRYLRNVSDGQPANFRNLVDPGNWILHAPPAPPAPPPTFPDTTGAELNAKRNVRRRAIAGGGVGSTILTGGYSPTGQASPVLGGD